MTDNFRPFINYLNTLVLVFLASSAAYAVDIEGVDRLRLLQELYMSSSLQGNGESIQSPSQLTDVEAEGLLGKQIEYLYGRAMKIQVPLEGESNELDTRLYNHDNGSDRAEKIVSVLKGSALVSSVENTDVKETNLIPWPEKNDNSKDIEVKYHVERVKVILKRLAVEIGFRAINKDTLNFVIANYGKTKSGLTAEESLYPNNKKNPEASRKLWLKEVAQLMDDLKSQGDEVRMSDSTRVIMLLMVLAERIDQTLYPKELSKRVFQDTGKVLKIKTGALFNEFNPTEVKQLAEEFMLLNQKKLLQSVRKATDDYSKLMMQFNLIPSAQYNSCAYLFK